MLPIVTVCDIKFIVTKGTWALTCTNMQYIATEPLHFIWMRIKLTLPKLSGGSCLHPEYLTLPRQHSLCYATYHGYYIPCDLHDYNIWEIERDGFSAGRSIVLLGSPENTRFKKAWFRNDGDMLRFYSKKWHCCSMWLLNVFIIDGCVFFLVAVDLNGK